MNRCPGCHRLQPKSWCLTCGDFETTRNRLEAHGKCKEDFGPETRGLPVAQPRDLVLALQGELL